MNKQRRNILSKCIEELEDIKSRIADVSNEENDAKDAMPESLQDTDRYYEMEENCDEMDDATGQIDDIIDILQGVIDK